MYIERLLENEIRKYLGRKEIIAILGPRQVGKTTLINRLSSGLRGSLVVSFEDRKILALFEEDEEAFAEQYIKGNKYLFIDEFQYAKNGGKRLKYLYDTYTGTKIIITGSSASDLSVHGIKYLVGRIFIFNLFPLSFSEFLKYKNEKLFNVFKNSGKKASMPVIEQLNNIYDEYVVYGGYPEVVISKDREEKELVLKNIYNTYLLKEIRDVLGIKDDFKIRKLMETLSINMGKQISYSTLREVSGFYHKELLENLNILEKSFIIKHIRPFFTNKLSEITKEPKIYFIDTGFRNIIVDDFREYKIRTDIGELNENFVLSQLAFGGITPKYWRTKHGTEVDFVIEKSGNITGLEVKSGMKKSKGVLSFRDRYNSKVFVLNRKEFKSDNVEYVPIVFLDKIIEK